MFGSLFDLLAIINKHFQRETKRRIPFPARRAFVLPSTKAGLKAKCKTFCAGPWLEYSLMRSQLQTAPTAYLQDNGGEEWGQEAEQHFKKSGMF